MMDTESIAIIATASTAIFSSFFTFLGIVINNATEKKLKQMEVYESRKLDAVEQFVKFADVCISEKRSSFDFYKNSSVLLPYLNRNQAESAIYVSECIRSSHFDEARRNLNDLCIDLQNTRRNGRSGKGKSCKNQ